MFKKEIQDKIFVFTETKNEEKINSNITVLKWIKEKDERMHRIVITTFKAMTGINFYSKCYVMLTSKPASYPTYIQCAGRVNRDNFREVKRIGFATENAIISTDSFEQTLKMKFA